MAYFASAFCGACRQPMTFNPDLAHLVPSIQRQPICAKCVAIYNANQKKLGRPKFVVAAGVYDIVPEMSDTDFYDNEGPGHFPEDEEF